MTSKRMIKQLSELSAAEISFIDECNKLLMPASNFLSEAKDVVTKQEKLLGKIASYLEEYEKANPNENTEKSIIKKLHKEGEAITEKYKKKYPDVIQKAQQILALVNELPADSQIKKMFEECSAAPAEQVVNCKDRNLEVLAETKKMKPRIKENKEGLEALAEIVYNKLDILHGLDPSLDKHKCLIM